MGKGKIRALILSLSVLILLILIMVFKNSQVKTSAGYVSVSLDEVSSNSISSDQIFVSGNDKSAEEDSNNIFSMAGQLISKFENAIDEKIEEIREEREAKKEAKELLLHKSDDEESLILKNADGGLSSVSSAKSSEDSYSPLISTDETGNAESSDYVAPYEISIPDSLKIPSKVGDTEFRTVNDYVYASDEAKLYDNPDFTGDPVMVSYIWEEFLRVGISDSCCYQLVSTGGELFYADGTHFRRHREDMPLTEEFTLKSERVMLDIDYISQFPTLLNGSEITCLATVLNFYGYDISKDDLCSGYLPMGKAGEANFYDSYVGDPTKKKSYGCYAGAIVTAANNYLSDIESTLRAVDYTGSTFKDLLSIVKEGNPVIVWTAKDQNEEPGFSDDWIVDGEYLLWKTNIHCVVLIGYDSNENTVIVCDPTTGIQELDMTLFIKRFKQFYSQAVLLD